MTVGELIGELQQYDESAEVLLATQPSWPFEYSIRGVIRRDEVISEEPDEPRAASDDDGPSDVFIIEGTQLRYGDKAIWKTI